MGKKGQDTGKQLSFLKEDKSPMSSPWLQSLAISVSMLVVNVGIIYLSHSYGLAFFVSLVGLGAWLWWHVAKNRQMSPKAVLIAILTSIVVTVILGVGISNTIGKNWDIVYKPILTMGRNDEQITTSDNQLKQALEAKVVFHVANVGTTTAYQIREQLCGVDGESPEMVSIGKSAYCHASAVNPLQPQEDVPWTVFVDTPYTEDNGVKTYVVKTWFIYCKLTYSDALSGGNSYVEEYWYSYSINDPDTLSVLTMEQKQQFLQSPIIQVLRQ